MKSELKYWIVALVLGAAVLILLYSLLSITGRAANEGDGEKIRIGGLFHLTGHGAFWGNGDLNGVTMAIEEINAAGGVNGYMLEFVIEDGETDFEKTVGAAQKLANVDNTEIIIGPTWFGQAISPIAEDLGVVAISPSTGTVPRPNKYFFNVWPTERQEIIPLVQKMKQDGVEEVVVVYNLNDWSESMKNNFVDEATDNGIEITEVFPITNGQSDFRTIITKISNEDTDAIYAPSAWYPDQGLFSKQSVELGLDVQIYSSSGTENPVLLESFPEVEGTIYPYPAITLNEEEFREKYEEKFGVPASPSAAYAYDVAYLVASALEETDGSPEEVAGYFRSVKYQGVSNYIEFDDDGRVREKEHVIKTVRNGEFVPLS